jgi:NADH:ubiquinone oxidoreductase subunit E
VSANLWKTKVDEVIRGSGKSKGGLLSCLEAIQEASGYIPQDAISYLRENLDVPSVDIYGVITFYGMLTAEKQGNYVIRLCDSLPCHLNKSEQILGLVERELEVGPGETSSDGKFTLETVACLGLCDKAPAMMVNDKVYGNLTEEMTKQILRELKK